MTGSRQLRALAVRLRARLPRPLWVTALILLPIGLGAQINVVENRYDAARTGANLLETVLNVNNVRPGQFGKLYSYPVDGPVYAQPLYVSNLTIGGVRRNVIFVATMNDKVYAFDAGSSSPTPLWLTDFTNPPAVTAVPITDVLPVNAGNIVGNLGVQGTPVIDMTSKTMFLVARTEENGVFKQRLHALDITTGRDRGGSPVAIGATVLGNAADSKLVGGARYITFDPKMHMQRAALALSNGVVLIAWATHEDIHPSHGWIMAYDATTFVQVPIAGQQAFAVVPDNYLGGIWQGGRAPAIDTAGNAYFSTGNGKYDGTKNYGDTLLKFSVSTSGLQLLSWFTPSNEVALMNGDDDLSGSGFTIIPGTNKLLGGGKEGVLYLLDGSNLRGKQAGDPQAQRIDVNGGHVMGGAVHWNSGKFGPLVYNWSEKDALRAYAFANGKVVVPDFVQSTVISPDHPGGSLTVSANGSTSGTAIIWASMPTVEGAKYHLAAGALRALHAETLEQLWNSDMATHDKVGNMMKFVPAVVANGKVFLPSHDNALHVYGLLPPAALGIGIDFVGTNTTAMDASERAGVVAQTNWNSAAGATRSTPLRLVDSTGASTGTTATWSSNNGYATPIADGAGDARMMRGYLDTSSTSTTTVNIAGLAPRAYDVYVYVDGANKSFQRTGTYTISGPGMTTTTITATDAASADFAGVFQRADHSAGNYVKFTVNGSSFTLSATPGPAATDTRRAPINGVQIVPAAMPRRPVAIDFVGTNATAMDPAETAGVAAQSNWNSAAGATRTTPLPLVDSIGAPSSATVTWSSNNGYATPITDAAGSARMMRGYLDTASTTTTQVSVAGLAAGTYDVYVYVDGANNTAQRSSRYTLTSAGGSTSAMAIDAANTNFAGTFTQADSSVGNYVKFTMTGSSFVLTATPDAASTTTRRAPVNGIQIVPR